MLKPVHRSVYFNKGHKAPNKMLAAAISEKDADFLTEQAISIFEDCVNVGVPFQSALASLLLTGIEWGVESINRKK